MQQKEIYDHRKEIEGLKEENVKLKQQFINNSRFRSKTWRIRST